MTVKISKCYMYPLKSGAGVKVSSLELGKKGPKHDREWMLVKNGANDDKKGRFITQRDKGCEKLALLHVFPQSNGDMKFTLPNGKTLIVENEQLTQYEGLVSVWGDECEALEAGEEAAKFFSEFLGIECALVKMPEDFVRKTESDFSKAGDHVSFADGFPLLITNEASLTSLSEHFPSGEDVNMQRFRPNIVLTGIDAFEEDVIHEVQIGDVVLEFVKPCSRCKITTIEQETASIPSKEPLQTLARVRRGKGGGIQGVFFGQHAIPRALGTVNVGDEVKILSKRKLHPALENVVLKPKSSL